MILLVLRIRKVAERNEDHQIKEKMNKQVLGTCLFFTRENINEREEGLSRILHLGL